MNSVMLVGRIHDIKGDTMEVMITKSYKNEKGEYEKFIVPVVVNTSMGKNVKDYCHKGDVVGIRGHFERNLQVYADKISFLSSTKRD